MADSFVIKVYSPAGLVLEDTATEVTFPSSEGEVGVLPNHAKYTTLLGTGVLSYRSADKDTTRRLVICEGFGTYSAGTFTILADSADLTDTIDPDSYAADRTELLKIIESGDTQDPQYQMAKLKLSRIEAIDQLISN